MTACLRCDGCGKVAAEHEDDLRKWWRMARHGVEWANEPNEAKGEGQSLSIHSVMMDARSMQEMMESDDSFAEMGMSMGEEEPMLVMHFCNSKCLGGWADQSASLEDAMGEDS